MAMKAQVEFYAGLEKSLSTERTIHWTDLTHKHGAVLDVIVWANRELRDAALALERFSAIRGAGLPPWTLALRQASGHSAEDFCI